MTEEQTRSGKMFYPCSLPRWAELPAPEQVIGVGSDAAEALGWWDDLGECQVTGHAPWRFEETAPVVMTATTCVTRVKGHGPYVFVVLWTPPDDERADLPSGEWINWLGLRHVIGPVFAAYGWMPMYRRMTSTPLLWHEKPLPYVPPPSDDTPNPNGDKEIQQ